MNECKDMRVVFERVVSAGEEEQRTGLDRELWGALLHYHYLTADLSSIQKLLQRQAAIYPDIGSFTIVKLNSLN